MFFFAQFGGYFDFLDHLLIEVRGCPHAVFNPWVRWNLGLAQLGSFRVCRRPTLLGGAPPPQTPHYQSALSRLHYLCGTIHTTQLLDNHILGMIIYAKLNLIM